MERVIAHWSDTSPLVLSAVAVGLSSIGYLLFKSRSGPPKGLVYPPSPPKDPIIGNFRSIPTDDILGTWNKWQKTYGDIVYLQLPGLSMTVVNDMEMALELLVKRANNTAGRLNTYMAVVLLGWSWAVTFRQPDLIHQQIRKLLRRGIGPQRVQNHDPLVEKSTRQLLLEAQGLRGNPADTIIHAVGRIIIQVTYGEKMWDEHGPELVDLNMEAMNILTATLGKVWMVDMFNFLRFIPSWMPGAEFRRIGIRSTNLVNRIHNWPFQKSVEQYASKELGYSLAADLFDEFGQTREVKDALGILYSVGTDSTGSAIIHFLHCMLLFPEIARKVQKEIDNAVGSDRLPKVTDRVNLPYTEAAWKEALRWNTSIPLGVPHKNAEDEAIGGYFIPKGTIISANVGFMLSDPKVWGDPEVFRPERHLASQDPSDASIPNPALLIFGFGMRICPGKDIADRIGFYISTAVMATYDILPFEGKSPPDPSTVEYTTDFIRWPKEFECRFVPRGQKATEILSSLEISGHH